MPFDEYQLGPFPQRRRRLKIAGTLPASFRAATITETLGAER
jgi:hypothetical protein